MTGSKRIHSTFAPALALIPQVLLLLALVIFVIVAATVPASAYSYPMRGVDEPWDHSPITIYINDDTVPQHYEPIYKESVLKAIDYWEDGGNGKLTYVPEFTFVDSATGVDINIYFVENLETVADAPKGVAGFASSHMQNDNPYMLDNVEIVLELGNYQGYSWRAYGKNNMFQISKHELGHALGLSHSSNPRDIMYFSYEQKQDIDPQLAAMTKPYFPYIVGAAIILFSYITMGYYRNKRERKALEDEIFSDNAKL
ncbi:MAG: matrixin family metalloprotease [Methanosarcinales archaeon]|nr:matrixin family metalloprotease [Methanosarcinales archaeon]